MKRNFWPARLALLLLISYAALLVSAMAAGSAGSESDPLVTVSYLNETFMSQLLSRVDEKLATRDRELADKLDAQLRSQGTNGQSGNPENSGTGKGDTFTVVDIEQGKTLYGEIGCEVMLRVGSASCVASSAPGLIDETDGTVLGGGASLAKNHIYMMTIEDRGVKSTAATTKVLVRGGYEIR